MMLFHQFMENNSSRGITKERFGIVGLTNYNSSHEILIFDESGKKLRTIKGAMFILYSDGLLTIDGYAVINRSLKEVSYYFYSDSAVNRGQVTFSKTIKATL